MLDDEPWAESADAEAKADAALMMDRGPERGCRHESTVLLYLGARFRRWYHVRNVDVDFFRLKHNR